MRGILTIAHVPCHLDRKCAEIDGCGEDLETRITLKQAADQARQRGAIVRDRDQFRHGQKMGDRDGHRAAKTLPVQRLEQTGTQLAWRKDVDVFQAFVLCPIDAVPDVDQTDESSCRSHLPRHAGQYR